MGGAEYFDHACRGSINAKAHVQGFYGEPHTASTRIMPVPHAATVRGLALDTRTPNLRVVGSALLVKRFGKAGVDISAINAGIVLECLANILAIIHTPFTNSLIREPL